MSGRVREREKGKKYTVRTYYGNKRLVDCMRAVIQNTEMKQ